MFFFVVVCALIGLWLRGPQGFVAGGALGILLGYAARAVVARRLGRVHSVFIDTTFAVMGALSKADGVVTRDEIEVAEQMFRRLRLSPEQTQAAKAAFNRGKTPDFDVDAAVERFAVSVPPGILYQLFLQFQLLAVTADGEIHPAEHTLLIRVTRRLGLGELAVAQLEALLRAAAAAAAGPASASAVPPRRSIEDAYAVLGVQADASNAELKRAYRKLISENHPDKLAAKGLPQGMREMVEERARQINAAYDLIKRARQL